PYPVAGEPANPVAWKGGENMLTPARFLAYLQQTAEAYDSIEPAPHEPALPGAFYLHPPLEGGDGRALKELCARFCPASDADADLIEAMLMTPFWGGLPGQRPAFLVTSEGTTTPAPGGGSARVRWPRSPPRWRAAPSAWIPVRTSAASRPGC